MAGDAATLAFHPPGLRLAEWAFLGFLLLTFVGLAPFAARDPVLFAPGAAALRGAGDTLRQAGFACAFAAIVFATLKERGWGIALCVPPALAALLLWCLASALWAAEPDLVLRRAALAWVIALSVFFSVTAVGPARSLQLLRWVTGLVLVINWLSIPLIHQAVHLPGDVEPLLVGDWRGLYFHKNIAGAVSAMTAIIFLFAAWDSRKLSHAAFCVAAVAFTVMTRSKFSLALLPLAVAAGALYRIAWPRPLDRLILAVCVALAVFMAAVAAVMDGGAITHLFANPAEFTGRAEIWQAEGAYIRDHPWFGAGFGTFVDTGAEWPLRHYVSSQWVYAVAEGHNGYLQALVTIGGVGFVLACVSLIAAPALRLWHLGGPEAAAGAVWCALFVFLALHNLLESDMLESDSPGWIAYLVMLAAMGAGARTEGPAQRRAEAT
jgi:O-antigen ligase